MNRFAKRIKKELGDIAKEAWVGAKSTAVDMHAKLLDALCMMPYASVGVLTIHRVSYCSEPRCS